MKKHFKKLSPILMALTLALGMLIPSIPAKASEIPTPMAVTDTTTIRVTGIEEGCEVWAYQIAALGTDGNSWVYGQGVQTRVEDGNISPSDIIYFYTNLNTGDNTDGMAHDGNGVAVVNANVLGLTWNAGDASYSISGVEPGLYVIAANKTTKEFNYSGNVVAVNFQYDGNGMASIADTNGVINVVAKKTDDPVLKKEVVTDNTTAKYGDAKIGDPVEFKVSLTLPTYDGAWATNNLNYVITDSLSEGLTLVQDSVQIEGTSVDTLFATGGLSGKSTVSKTTEGFTLNLFGEDVYQYSAKTISITYSATINSSAKVNFADEENEVSIRYSTTAGGTDLSSPMTDKTYHYTFGIDTNINGTGSSTTSEITKYGVRTTTETNNKVALAGAQFQLTDAQGNVMYFTPAGQYTTDQAAGRNYVETTATGQLVITGLDAGTYTLKESKAPDGYALDTTTYTVTITPTYNDLTGELKNYSVTISGGANNAITFTHEMLDNGTINSTDNATDVDTFGIINTPLLTLPETGGAGIIVVTVIAVVMMVGFGTMFLLLKKKNPTK